jgi:hypothetical protein
MRKLVDAFESIGQKATDEAKAVASKGYTHDDFILNLSRIVTPEYLKGAWCKELRCVAEEEGFRDLAALLFSFQSEDIFPEVHVPYFDNLYSEIASSGHPLASVLFGKQWLIVLRPRSDLPADLQDWCWRVLRDGFGNANPVTQ